MSKPLSAHRHVQREPFTRAVISPFGGYVQVPVPKAPPAVHTQTSRTTDPSSLARTTLNPAKAAAGHAEMNSHNYGTGAPYTFRVRVGGVMPGYSGHRPGARDVAHRMAYGGVPTFNAAPVRRPPGQGQHLSNNPTTSWSEIGHGWKEREPGDSRSDEFKGAVGGVLCGYTGFVPNARTHCGSSHVGGLADAGHRGRYAQRGHQGHVERLQGDRELNVSARTERASVPLVGYQGHVPKAMESFGTSHWRDGAVSARRAQRDLYSA
jgi:hypothetical protein